MNFFRFMIFVFVALFYFSTIDRKLTGYGGDEELYMLAAKNIAMGKGVRPDYIVNPSLPIHPEIPPYFLPLCLSISYKFGGDSFFVMKLIMTSFTLLYLYAFYYYIKDWFSYYKGILVFLTMALNYRIWDMKDDIMTEIPFMFFMFLIFILHAKLKNSFFKSLILGFTIYLAYATRTIGFVFIPSLFLYELINLSSIKFSIKVALFFLIFWTLHYIFIGSVEKAYIILREDYWSKLYNFEFEYVFGAFMYLLKYIFSYFFGAYTYILRGFLAAGNLVFSLYGFIKILRFKKLSEVFVIIYIPPILLYVSIFNPRYFVPLLPFILFYMFYFIETLNNKTLRNIIFYTIIFLSIPQDIIRIITSLPGETDYYSKSTLEAFEFIKRHTLETDVFIAAEPARIKLMTDRNASVLHTFNDDAFEYFKKIDVRYVVVRKNIYDTGLLNLIHRNKKYFTKVFSNDEYFIFRYKIK